MRAQMPTHTGAPQLVPAIPMGFPSSIRKAPVSTPEIYNSFVQNTVATSDAGVSLVIQSRVRAEALANAVRNAIHQMKSRPDGFQR
jgi:hypothetical protein